MTPAVPAKPLAPTALYEQVAGHLRERILNRQLEPGNWIDEQALCAELGISRTPMREALKVLAVEGLVTMKVRRGAYVTEMSREDVTQVYHLLALLEADAAAQVASGATPEQLAVLQHLHQDLEAKIEDRTAFFAANERFHMQLLEYSSNRWRTQIVNDLRKVMKLNRHHSLFSEGRLAESLAEHRQLMAALQSGDAGACRDLMLRHFHNSLAAMPAVSAP